MSPPDRPAARPLLVYGPWSARYDLGPTHPLTPRRFGPGIDLLCETAGQPDLLAPEPAADDVLAWVHERPYIATVRRFSEMPFGPGAAGIGRGDTPAFPGMHEASAAVAGGSVAAMQAILDGRTDHAFHPGGGLHHAMPGRASGFCVYDDPALAIACARRAGRRVLYIDLDVHHGDGVQAIHWDDPGVLTISIHQSGQTLFPGTGFVNELGVGVAAGTSVNLPVDPGTGEAGWLTALRRVVPELAAAFGPDVIVSQHGADAHAWDPLANLNVTTTAMGAAARMVDAIAHRWAGGRWLATGGGGYDAYRVVPRVWSLVWLAMLHAQAAAATPAGWRGRWIAEAERYGQAPLPERLDDEPNAGLRRDASQEAADRAAGQTAGVVRELVVPILLRAAGDFGWWSAAADLDLDLGRAPRGSGSAQPLLPSDRQLAIVDIVDAEAWSALRLASGTLPPADPTTGHELIQAALEAPEEVAVTAAIVDAWVVGAVVSASVEGGRALLGLGVAPGFRRRGLAAELLRRHLAVAGPEARWEAVVTVAERDPADPLSRATRRSIARRLLEGNGFTTERPAGTLGAADAGTLVGHRG